MNSNKPLSVDTLLEALTGIIYEQDFQKYGNDLNNFDFNVIQDGLNVRLNQFKPMFYKKVLSKIRAVVIIRDFMQGESFREQEEEYGIYDHCRDVIYQELMSTFSNKDDERILDCLYTGHTDDDGFEHIVKQLKAVFAVQGQSLLTTYRAILTTLSYYSNFGRSTKYEPKEI